jgi:DNA polymerase III sliding clamp (beta) subunit (PCNA family)
VIDQLPKISLEDGNKLNQVLEALSSIADEVEFVLDEKGVRVREYDPGRVAMVDLWMSREMMLDYDLEGQQKFRFRAKLSELKKLKLKSSPVSLTFQANNKCVVQQQKPYERTFNLTLPTIESLEVPPLKCDFEAEAKITLEGFRSIIDDAKICTDYVRIYATTNALQFSNSDMLSYEATLKKGETESLLSLDVKAEARATFSIKYLDDVSRSAASLGDIILMKFKTDFPVALCFETKDPNILSVMFALAPRIESE